MTQEQQAAERFVLVDMENIAVGPYLNIVSKTEALGRLAEMNADKADLTKVAVYQISAQPELPPSYLAFLKDRTLKIAEEIGMPINMNLLGAEGLVAIFTKVRNIDTSNVKNIGQLLKTGVGALLPGGKIAIGLTLLSMAPTFYEKRDAIASYVKDVFNRQSTGDDVGLNADGQLVVSADWVARSENGAYADSGDKMLAKWTGVVAPAATPVEEAPVKKPRRARATTAATTAEGEKPKRVRKPKAPVPPAA